MNSMESQIDDKNGLSLLAEEIDNVSIDFDNDGSIEITIPDAILNSWDLDSNPNVTIEENQIGKIKTLLISWSDKE